MMSAETCCKIKAALLTAMLAVAEARTAQQAVFNAKHDLQSHKLESKADNAVTKCGVSAKPTTISARHLDPLQTDLASHEQANLFLEQMGRQKKAKLFAQQLQAIVADQSLQEQAMRVAKELTASMESGTKLQEHAKRITGYLEDMKSNPQLQQHAELMAQQIEAAMTSAKFQQHTKLAAQEMENIIFKERSRDSARRLELNYTHMVRGSVDNMVVKLVDILADDLFKHTLRVVRSPRPDRGRMTGSIHSRVYATGLSGMRNFWRRSSGSFQSRGGPLGLVHRSHMNRKALVAAANGNALVAAPRSMATKLANIFCNLFAVWLAVAAFAAIRLPSTFTAIPNGAFLGLFMLHSLSIGMTTSINDFKSCLSRPGALAINFIACYGIMPMLAYVIAKVTGADGTILAGLVLVGAIYGNQASNLCTFMANGDVALSMLLTASTTLGSIVMTPLICKTMLGHVVPMNAAAFGIYYVNAVVLPIVAGVALNSVLPNLTKAVKPYTLIIGVVYYVLLLGDSVTKYAHHILKARLPLHLACLSLHLIGGALGYMSSQALNFDKKTCRTVAIETAMKTSAFAFLLAPHFSSVNVRLPLAVSVLWTPIIGSILALYWKGPDIPCLAVASPKLVGPATPIEAKPREEVVRQVIKRRAGEEKSPQTQTQRLMLSILTLCLCMSSVEEETSQSPVTNVGEAFAERGASAPEERKQKPKPKPKPKPKLEEAEDLEKLEDERKQREEEARIQLEGELLQKRVEADRKQQEEMQQKQEEEIVRKQRELEEARKQEVEEKLVQHEEKAQEQHEEEEKEQQPDVDDQKKGDSLLDGAQVRINPDGTKEFKFS